MLVRQTVVLLCRIVCSVIKCLPSNCDNEVVAGQREGLVGLAVGHFAHGLVVQLDQHVAHFQAHAFRETSLGYLQIVLLPGRTLSSRRTDLFDSRGNIIVICRVLVVQMRASQKLHGHIEVFMHNTLSMQIFTLMTVRGSGKSLPPARRKPHGRLSNFENLMSSVAMLLYIYKTCVYNIFLPSHNHRSVPALFHLPS